MIIPPLRWRRRGASSRGRVVAIAARAAIAAVAIAEASAAAAKSAAEAAAKAAAVAFAIVTIGLAHHRGGTFLQFVDADRDVAQHFFGKTLLALDLG